MTEKRKVLLVVGSVPVLVPYQYIQELVHPEPYTGASTCNPSLLLVSPQWI
jgi:hypothetical protein